MRLLLRIALAIVTTAAVAADSPVNEQNVRTFYRDFTRLTRQPHQVAPLTAVLCTMNPSPAIVEREKQMTGPHHQARIHLYANPLAMPAVGSGQTPFAMGAIIVKEKLGQDGQVSGVGGMIKREPGYDPLNGDWEYFYYGGPKEFSAGHIASCIECHRAAKARDHVYSVWGPWN